MTSRAASDMAILTEQEFVKVPGFIQRHYRELNQGGWPTFRRKVKNALLRLASVFLMLPALPAFFAMRLLRPWILIRISPLISSRLGHLAANIELYLCERDAGINVPARRHVDLCYFAYTPLANVQLANMLRRHLRIGPAWLLGAVYKLNRVFPGGSIHEVGNNTQHDRDVHNLLERMPPHLGFTPEEELRGKAGLQIIGIPADAEFICLTARDSAYLGAVFPGNFDYHNYRDVDIQNYVLAVEALAERGYYVVRMGAVVKAPIKSSHPKVIDYATNGMRTEFMDIYLGARCLFCISCGTGFDAIPLMFRRPIAYVNMLPVGYFFTFLKDTVGIFKKHWLVSERRWLSLREIFSRGVGFCMSSTGYEIQGVNVIENTPEEIRSLVIEMLERLKGTWQPWPDDDVLQRRFWEIYPIDARDSSQNRPLHGKIRARHGAQFLRDNLEWLV